MSSLTPTARVILGMLKLGLGTGYDIKKVIDFSTRFFWTASYGQIYPELKRLAEAGMVDGIDDPSGGRARTVWSLTDAGREQLRQRHHATLPGRHPSDRQIGRCVQKPLTIIGFCTHPSRSCRRRRANR